MPSSTLLDSIANREFFMGNRVLFWVIHRVLYDRVLFRVLIHRVILIVFSDRVLFRVLGDRVPFRVLIRVLSDKVLIRGLSDRILFMILNDSFLFRVLLRVPDPWFIATLRFRINGEVLISRGVENFGKYNKQGGWNIRGFGKGLIGYLSA